MSVRMSSLVWDYFPAERRSEMLLALKLADNADDRGCNIFPSVGELAAKTRQNERTVQRQMKTLRDYGWLICIQMSNGGRNRSSRYMINPSWIADPAGWTWTLAASGAQCPDKAVHDQPDDADIPRQIAGVSGELDPPETPALTTQNPGILPGAYNRQEPSIPPYVEDSETTTARGQSPDDPEAAEDRRLAEWMLAKVRALNPKHRPPPWRRWCRDLRLMRERDKCTRREIAELFAWANGDPFWQTNILSPGKLRAQLDQLRIRRAASMSLSGRPGAGTPTAPPADRRCAWESGGLRCTCAGARSVGLHGRWYCEPHLLELERQSAMEVA